MSGCLLTQDARAIPKRATLLNAIISPTGEADNLAPNSQDIIMHGRVLSAELLSRTPEVGLLAPLASGCRLSLESGRWRGGGRGIEGRERVLAMNPRRTDFAVVNAGQRTRALVFRRQPQTRLNGALHVVRVAVQYGVMFDRQGIFNGAWREPGRFVHGPGPGNTYGAKATDCLR